MLDRSWHAKLLGSPRYPRFPTFAQIDDRIGELQRSAPGIVSVRTLGRTHEGRPLRALTIGKGERHALVIGMPHPNEPTGGLAALRLAELLAHDRQLRNELGLKWHIVPCADPDGAALNERWYGGPFTLLNYASGIYRPPFTEQFEWTFHRPELQEPGLRPTPMSQAVMELIDEVRPELVVSMHNAEAGGIYAYASQATVAMVDAYERAQFESGLPADSGLPEDASDLLVPGLFYSPPNLDGGSMLSSVDYAAKYGAVGVVVETPLWIDHRAGDTAFTRTKGELGFAAVEEQRKSLRGRYQQWLDRLADDLLQSDTPRWRAVRAGTDALQVPWEPFGLSDEYLTIAELTSLERNFQMERLRLAGHLSGAIAETAADTTESPRQVFEEIASTLKVWAREAFTGAFCGLDSSVQGHLSMALACARAVR